MVFDDDGLSAHPKLSDVLKDVEACCHSIIDVRLNGDVVRLAADRPEPLRWLAEYLGAYYELSQSAGESSYKIFASENAAVLGAVTTVAIAGLYLGRESTYQGQSVDDYLVGSCLCRLYTARSAALIVSGRERAAFFIASPGDVESTLEPTRHVREFFSRQWERRGYWITHAAAVCWDDAAVAFIGGKGSGKSTISLGLVANASANFISNDRIHLGLSSGTTGDAAVAAWPTSVKIGVGTARTIPQLQRWLNIDRHFAYPQTECTPDELEYFATCSLNEELWAAKQKIELTPSEIAATFDCRVRSIAKLRLLIFPRLTKNNSTTEIVAVEPSWVEHELTRESFTPNDPSYPDWLQLRESKELTLRVATARSVRMLARTIPALRVTFSDVREAVEALRSSLARFAEPRQGRPQQ